MKPRADTTKRFPVRNAAGNRQCRECGKERPDKAAWLSWCSDACVEAYKIRAWPAHARQAALKRDKGVCSICGIDTERLRAWLKDLPHGSFKQHGRNRARAIRLLRLLWGCKVGYPGHLAEVDHIVPVAEGGGGCGLDNLRTLCRKCHRIETIALRERLRRRPTKGVRRGF